MTPDNKHKLLTAYDALCEAVDGWTSHNPKGGGFKCALCGGFLGVHNKVAARQFAFVREADDPV
jgi:hypothetical protein